MSAKVLSESATIHRAQQDVWAYLTTTEHWQEWYTEGLTGVSPAWQEGATLTFVSGSKPAISHYAPPELLQWGKGTAIRLAAIDANTTEITYSHTVGGIFLQDPMLLAEYENMFYTDTSRMLQKLKQRVESQAPEPPAEDAEPAPAVAATATTAAVTAATVAPTAVAPVVAEPEPAPPDTEPATDDPAADQPAADEPAADQPVADEPATDESAADEPAADEPATDESAADEPAADEPATDESAADEPAADQPVADEPATDQPAADEPAADQPVADEPATDESAADEPAEDHSLEATAAAVAATAAVVDTEPVTIGPTPAAPPPDAPPSPPVPEPAQEAEPDAHPGASRILNSSVVVHSEPSETSPRVAECHTGDRVQFGTAKENEGKTWVEVTLADGRQGYLLGSTRHFPASRAFACLPISGDTVAATFPQTCVYCAQPADTELEVVYDEAPRGKTRPPGALLAKLQVPYCATHARESKRNRRAIVASILVPMLLAALAAVSIGYGIIQRGIFGFESDELVFLAALVGFCGTAYATHRLVTLLAGKLLPRLFKSMAHMGRGQLGIWLSRAPGDKALVLQCLNAEFARQFRALNPYEYHSLAPEPAPSPASIPGVPAAPPEWKTTAPPPAARKRPRRGLLMAGGIVALLVLVACVAALAGLWPALTAPSENAGVEVPPTQVRLEQEVTVAPSPTTEPATAVQVELEPTASPGSVELEPTATSEPTASPVPTSTPAPTHTPSPTRTPRPTNTTAPSEASPAGPLILEADSPVLGIAFSPDGGTLASVGEDGALQLWDTATGTVLRTLGGHPGGTFSVAFSPDGQTLASGGDDDLTKLWDVSSGSLLQTLAGHDLWVNSVAYSPDGASVASGSADRSVKLWAAATGKVLHTLEAHTDWVRSLAFSPGGDLLASGSCAQVDADQTSICLIGEIILWDAATGERIKTINDQTGWIHSLAFSPDGQLLASGASDDTITLWNVAEGKPLTTLKGHKGRVNSLAFSPDGTLLISGSDDDSARLWTVATGKLAKVLKGHLKWVNGVAFAPDGQRVATASADGTIRLWEVPADQ